MTPKPQTAPLSGSLHTSGRGETMAQAMRFAWRELRGGLRGFYVFIACIALGVAAIAGVLSVSRALTDGISTQGQQILGGDIAFRLIHREADSDEATYLASLGHLSRVATMRAMARLPRRDDQALVELKAVDDLYPLYGAVRLGTDQSLQQALAPHDGIPGAVADPSLMTRLDLSVGDEIHLGNSVFRITDTLVTEPDRLSGGLQFGPRLLVAEPALRQTGLVQPGSLISWIYRLRLPSSVSDAEIDRLVAAANNRFPKAGWRTQTRSAASPGLSNSINRFAQFLTLIGLTALIVGGVGVANAVRFFLERKQTVIASFKCLGASGSFIFRIYLIQMLAIALIGILLGLILGAIIPFLVSGVLSGILNLTISSSVYPSQLALAVVYGVLTTLTFTIWPLGRAHDVSPSALFRDRLTPAKQRPRLRYVLGSVISCALLIALALVLADEPHTAAIYLAATACAFLLLELVARGIMSLAKRFSHVRNTELRLAIGNIYRPGALTPSVILSLGLGLSLLVSLALIDGNLRRELSGTIANNAPSFFFIDVQRAIHKDFQKLLHNQAPNATVQSVPMLRGTIVRVNGTPSAEVTPLPEAAWALRGDRGVTFSAAPPENSTVTAGQWWPKDYQGEPLVSFDEKVATGLGLKIGDTVTVNVLGREITARIANLRKIEWQSLAINFIMVFSPNTFEGAPVSYLLTVRWPNEVSTHRELSLLKTVSSKYPTVTAIRVKEAISQVNNMLGQMAWAVRCASAITLIASIMVLAGALAAGNRNRIYDAVILKTLGATRTRLLLAYCYEYALLGIATAIFALIAGGVIGWFVISNIMGGSFVMLPGTAAMAILVALILSIGFGLIGTWRILGEKPAAILRNL